VTETNADGLVADKTITATATFDALNRKITATNALGNTTSYRYDSHNNLIQTQDPLGNTSLHIIDGLNRTIETRQWLTQDGTGTSQLDQANPVNADGAISTFYAFDGNSRLIAQSDDAGNQTRYFYDALNRNNKTTYADGTQELNTFDADDNITQFTDQAGTVFTQQFDALNRMVVKSVAPVNGLVGSTRWTYEYDGLSRLIESTDNNDPQVTGDDAIVRNEYNSLNQRLRETQFANSHVEKTVQTGFDGMGTQKSYRLDLI